MDKSTRIEVESSTITVGLIENGSIEAFEIAGSAFFISPYCIMTAAHVLASCQMHQSMNSNKNLKIGLVCTAIDDMEVKFDFNERK